MGISEKGREFEVQVKGNVITKDPFVMLKAAVNGIGVTLYLEEMIQRELCSKKLEIVLDPYSTKSNGFYLYYPKRSQVMPKLRAFIDHVKKFQG